VRSAQALLQFVLTAFAVGVGCGGTNAGSESASLACDSDADCGSHERCDLSMYPRIAAMCSFAPCGSNGECPADRACQPPPPGSQTPGWGGCPELVCGPRCTPTGCPLDQVCRESGLCGYRQCDEPGQTCPVHYRCESTGELGVSVEEWFVSPSLSGCVLVRCDEPDGYVCPDGWGCAPAETTETTGCVPLPCGETGHCERENHICEPTSTAQRAGPPDLFGCVPKNCEEGLACTAPTPDLDAAYCDPSAPNADANGCVIRSCAEGTTCSEGFVCVPNSPNGDRIGCIAESAASGAGRCVPWQVSE